MLPATVAQDVTPGDPWQAAASLDYNQAARLLEPLQREHADDPRIATAFAASLLVRDPVTASNIQQAQSILENLLIQLPRAEQRYRPLTIYLLARIAHDHVEPAQLDTARARYEQLRCEYPGHPLADQAAVHLGLLLALQQPPVDSGQAVSNVESLLTTVTEPAAQRELHYLLAYLFWQMRGDAAAALPHYIAGREIGFEAPYRNGEVDLTIAGLARELGRNELAAQHYLAFAEANPRDGRAQTARRLAAEALAQTRQAP